MSQSGGYYAIRDVLKARLAEQAPGRVQILAGPRQVGKTTLLLEIAREWGDSAVYVAADAPEAALAGWWDAQWRSAVRRARADKSVLLVDEVQYLPGWSRLVKSAVDEVLREQLPLHIVVTGSASLTVGAGAKETMAGRFERLLLRHWTARDLALAFDLMQEEAIRRFVTLGAFPGSMAFVGQPERWRAYVLDSIIDPAIGRDLLMLELVRKPALLRQVFAVCVGHPSEVISLAKITGSLTDPSSLQTVAHYLEVLGEAFLVAALQKFSTRELRRRASPSKLVPLSNAFLAASTPNLPDPGSDPERWGRWVENACLAFAVNAGQEVHYWREEPLEVDMILSGSWGKWAVEIKTGALDARDLRGLLEFSRRYPDYRPLLLCDPDHAEAAIRVGIDWADWREFLWNGLPT